MFLEGTSRFKSSVNRAHITDEGELTTRSITIPDEEHAVTEGDGYGTYTGEIELTDDSQQAIMYIETQEERDILVTGLTISSGASTGGADNSILIEQVGNVLPTDAIVTGGTDILVINRNSGSPKQFQGTIKTGPAANFAAGIATNGVRGDFTSPQPFDLLTQLTKGSKVGVRVTPPAGNTSMKLIVTMSFFILETV